MNDWDASNNSINRRYDRGRVYVTDERHDETGDGVVDRDQHERFYLNQYYNAVEFTNDTITSNLPYCLFYRKQQNKT